MRLIDLRILKGDIVNQPITIALITIAVPAGAWLFRHLWMKRKPKVHLTVSFCLKNGAPGLCIKVVNHSVRLIRIESVGYDMFGNGDPRQSFSFLKDEVLEPQSSLEKFIEEANLHLDSMKVATVVFAEDQIGRLWKFRGKSLEVIQRYEDFQGRAA
jgi:hypothetical protein